MWRLMLGAFLIAHGFVHVAVWALPISGAEQPFDPHQSWLLDGLGDKADTWISIFLAVAAGFGFVAAGFGMVGRQEAWRPLAVAAAAVSLLLITFFFHPWLTVGLAIEVAILVALLWVDWPREDLVGA